MEKSTKKKVIAITVVLLVAGGITGYLLWKRNKDKKEKEDTNSDSTSTNYGLGLTPGSEGSVGSGSGGSGSGSGSIGGAAGGAGGSGGIGGSASGTLAKSFSDVKKFFVPQGQTWNSDPYFITLNINGVKRLFQFYSNGRYFGFTISDDGKKWNQNQSGNYSHGGKHITITSGRNSGKGFQKATPTEAVKAAMNL